MNRGVLIGIGLFFGLILGYLFAVIAHDETDQESYRSYEERTRGPEARGPERPARPAPKAPAAGEESGHGGADEGHGGGPEGQFAKIHFMKKFVAALTSRPQNAHPNPTWESPLKDASVVVQCSDCHKSGDLDFNKMREMDPGAEKVDRFRHAPQYMIPLMQKWVERLNRELGPRLKAPVTCTTCHAVDPNEKFEVYPALMVRFVAALYEKPKNKEPASRWQPLVKDAGGKAVKCSTCHASTPGMDRMMGADLPRPAKYADNHAFMEEMMTYWVERLNRDAGPLLTKVVVCGDCHETDPRK